MDASLITFGIEIETTIPNACPVDVGGYSRGLQAAGFPEGWVAKHDRSIRAGAGRRGCEFVSPVLRGADGLRQVVTVLAKLREIGAEVNQSTGLHVHVGFDRSDRAALTRLVTLSANFEKAIYASTGTRRRETNQYCSPISPSGSAEQALNVQSRYRLLNLVSNKPTVEFRAFAGTLNTSKVIGHIRMCVALVQRALEAKRVTDWTAKTPVETSPIRRSGAGQTALTRFFYQVGWIKGRTDRTLGVVEADGLPNLKDSKRALMTMARKYDQRTEG